MYSLHPLSLVLPYYLRPSYFNGCLTIFSPETLKYYTIDLKKSFQHNSTPIICILEHLKLELSSYSTKLSSNKLFHPSHSSYWEYCECREVINSLSILNASQEDILSSFEVAFRFLKLNNNLKQEKPKPLLFSGRD